MKQHIISLRILATFFVIILHTSAVLLASFEKNGMEYWWYGNVFDSLSRWCVPIFFMISGALLLNKVDDFQTFYKKRLQKVFIPFIIWSMIYLVYQLIADDRAITSLIKQAFMSPYYHLWFLYAILGLYVVTPFLQRWLQVTSQKMLFWFLLFWFFNVAFLPLFTKFTHIPVRFSIPMAIGNVGFFLLGYYLEKYKPRIPIWIFPMAGLITIVGTYVLTRQNNGIFDGFFYEYSSFNVILMAMSLYAFMQKCTLRIPFASFLDRYSFGVYLIHALILSELQKRTSIDASFIHPMVGIVVTFAIVLFSSYILIWVLSKIPYVKRII